MMCCTPAASYAAIRARSSPRSRPSQFTRVEMVKSAPGRSARRRRTIAAVCSGVSREPCQPSARRIVRRSAASELPPIHSGIGAIGQRRHGHVGDLGRDVFGGERHRVLRPDRAHQRDAFVHAAAALVERGAECGELGSEPADAGAQDEAAVGEVLQRGEFLRQRDRMAHRQHEDGGAETHALGDGGDPGEGEDRLVERQLTGELGAGQDDVLADPDVGEPQRLGLEGEAADQGGGGAFAVLLSKRRSIRTPNSSSRS